MANTITPIEGAVLPAGVTIIEQEWPHQRAPANGHSDSAPDVEREVK